jgi:FAD/FMN-containing dehydrogenase
MVSESGFKEFRASLRGRSFCPDDDGYGTARTIPNAMIDQRPALIVRCAGAADVIACVRYARENDLLVSVRGGGHSVSGKSVCDGALMIDLSAMKGIRVDPARRTVRAETGLTLGEFDRETQAFGLATTLGLVPAVGIAGLTLGGGWGQLHAKFGLAVDNVIGADVVTADGSLLTVSAAENPDLFWGIRGGSGNFGVVTSLEYRLHEVGPVFGGGIFYSADRAKQVLQFLAGIRIGEPRRISYTRRSIAAARRCARLRNCRLLLRIASSWRKAAESVAGVC